MNTCKLIIDTTDNKEITVGCVIDGVRKIRKQPVSRQKAQIVLFAIDELLTAYNKTLSDVTFISVNAGPGSFTGIRVGLSVANLLGQLYQIPLNGQPVGETVKPIYG